MEDEVEYGGEGEAILDVDEGEEVEEDEEEMDEGEIDEMLKEDEVEPSGDLKRKLPVELVEQEEPQKKKKKRKRAEKCLVCGEKGHRKMDCPRWDWV